MMKFKFLFEIFQRNLCFVVLIVYIFLYREIHFFLKVFKGYSSFKHLLFCAFLKSLKTFLKIFVYNKTFKNFQNKICLLIINVIFYYIGELNFFFKGVYFFEVINYNKTN